MNQRKHLIVILILAAIGLAASAYLTYLHQQIFSGQMTDFSFCGISRTISCEAVSASPYSEWFGAPIAWYGVLGYLLWLSLASLGLYRPETHADPASGLIFITAAGGFLIDLYLAYMMTFKIHSLCLLCLLTYVLNLAILIITFRVSQNPVATTLRNSIATAFPFTAKTSYGFSLLFVFIAVIGLAGGNELRKTTENALANFDEAGFIHYQTSAPRHNVDITSDPYLGAKDADLTIVEFSDFQCPYCKKAHFILQTILPAYFGSVKFIFKNLPLSSSCNPQLQVDMHPAACKLARLGEAAFQQGKFWPMHDLIFAHQAEFEEKIPASANLMRLSRQAGMDIERLAKDIDSARTRLAVQSDIRAASGLGISGTPVFLFNGLLLHGIPQPGILQRIIEIELQRARSLPDSGKP